MNRTYPWMLVGPVLILGAATIEGFWLQRSRGRYDWRAYFASLGDLAMRIAFRFLPLGLATSALNWFWGHRLYTMPLKSVWPWALLFVGQDFFYYWMHRADHRVRWLWATHSVHHSPNELNLSAAYRLGWTSRLSIAPIFFAPLVVMGFPPLVVGAALALNLLYQFWLHAPWIPRLGPLERLLNTPAHHRMHHASNPEYLDANFGGVLIVFDRWFGTYREELADVPIRYGLVDPVKSYNPLFIGMREWVSIGRDVWSARSLREAFTSIFGPPRPKGILHSGTRDWAIDLDVSTRQTRFDGFPVSRSEVSRQDQAITADGNANCTLHDIGYGGTLTYTADSWSGYGSGGANRYDNTACSYSVAEPNALQRLSAYDFQSLSGALLDRAQLRAGGQIGQQTQLLQSQFGAGISHSWGRTALAFDYLHAKAEFGDTIQAGYALSGTIPVLKAVAVKLTVGTTITNSVSAPYGGLYVLVNL